MDIVYLNPDLDVNTYVSNVQQQMFSRQILVFFIKVTRKNSARIKIFWTKPFSVRLGLDEHGWAFSSFLSVQRQVPVSPP